MALADDDFAEIRSRVLAAYDVEEPVIQKLRQYARHLKNSVVPIQSYSANAVSFVSADGGDNRLYFNPAVVELVRVVDSRGNQCALDAIAGNAQASVLNSRIDESSSTKVPPLKRLCDDLSLKVGELSYLLNGLGQPGKSTGAIRTYRDIVEWAVLYDLLHMEWGSDTIVVREGLLRTKSFKKSVFPMIDQRIRNVCERHRSRHVNVSIIGVAKQSAVLSRLAVAMELEGTFHKPFACYAKVPRDIEEDCYNFDRTWLDTMETTSSPDHTYQSMGSLFLAKFGDRPYDPVWPVDLAIWDVTNAPRLIGQLQNDAQPGFPIPDFPQSVQKAHDFAKINGIEVSVLQDILFDGVSASLSVAERERVLRLRYLGRDLLSRRYKNA